MVRGKVHLRKIENPVNRRVTFSKRKGGLLKKAKEISTLCGADVGLIIFSPTGKLFEFANPNMSRIMARYQKFGTWLEHQKSSSEYFEVLGMEFENLERRLTHLKKMHKHITGEDLDMLNFKELKCLEKKISLGVKKINLRKDKVSQENIRSLKVKEKSLKLENAELDKQIGRIRKAFEINLDIMETDGATQQDLPQANLNLTLS